MASADETISPARVPPAAPATGDERLRRIVQIAADLSGKPLGELRVLDLACYEGQFAIEFARLGATAVGIEGREENVLAARARAEPLKLERLELIQGDVRGLSREDTGGFDVVLCLGLLYHLDFPDVIRVLERIAGVCDGLAIFDTHINVGMSRTFRDGGHTYRGRAYIEHSERAGAAERERSRWASLDNTISFWPTRASLINALMDAGFTSVYECEVPAQPSEAVDRRTIVAVKGERVALPSEPGAEQAPSARVPERRPRSALLRNHAPGTNLLKRVMLDIDAIRARRGSRAYGPRSFGRRR